ncbi:MAG: hypothetical protein WDN00_02535 [Limisphaerales bacterium]
MTRIEPVLPFRVFLVCHIFKHNWMSSVSRQAAMAYHELFLLVGRKRLLRKKKLSGKIVARKNRCVSDWRRAVWWQRVMFMMSYILEQDYTKLGDWLCAL